MNIALPMQMRPGHPTRSARKAQKLVLMNHLPLTHLDLAHMKIHRHHAKTVVDHHGVSGIKIISGQNDPPRARRINRRSKRRMEIDATVIALELSVINALGSKRIRHSSVERELESAGPI